MHERGATGVVQRVRPASIWASQAGDRIAVHSLASVVRIDDVALQQPAAGAIERADSVARGVARRGVLDQIDPAAIRRDRVEAEVAGQMYVARGAQAPRIT